MNTSPRMALYCTACGQRAPSVAGLVRGCRTAGHCPARAQIAAAPRVVTLFDDYPNGEFPVSLIADDMDGPPVLLPPAVKAFE